LIHLLIETIKLLVVVGGSAMEVVRALADIRELLVKVMTEVRDHCRKAIGRGKDHYKKKRRKRNA
jgi:hypothetical protein